MQKFEFVQQDVDEIVIMIEYAKKNTKILAGMNIIDTITIRRGDYSYSMGIIYAALLAEYMQEQLDLGNVVDVVLYTTQEWLDIEEELQNTEESHKG